MFDVGIIQAGPLIPPARFALSWRERIDWSHEFPVGFAAWNNPFALSRAMDPARTVCQIIGEWGVRQDPPTAMRAKAEINANGQYLDFSSYGGSGDTTGITYSGSVTILEFKTRPKRIQKVATKGAAVALAYSVDPLRALIFNACFHTGGSGESAPGHLIDANTINTSHAYDSSYCCVYVVEF